MCVRGGGIRGVCVRGGGGMCLPGGDVVWKMEVKPNVEFFILVPCRENFITFSGANCSTAQLPLYEMRALHDICLYRIDIVCTVNVVNASGITIRIDVADTIIYITCQ